MPEATPSPAPVVFFAPGYGVGSPFAYDKLVAHLVSRGYAVIFAATPFEPGRIDQEVVMRFYGYFVAAFDEAVRTFPSAFDTSRIGYIGHSFGGGALPFLAWKGLKERGWGGRGTFLFVMAPWYMYGMTQQALATFPSNVKMIMQVYDNDRMNDHRIAVNIFDEINLPAEAKEYVILNSDARFSCRLEADHFTPLTSGVPVGVENGLDFYGVYRLLDALTEYTFDGIPAAGSVALGHGTPEQRFMGRWPDRTPVKELSAPTAPEPLSPEVFYEYRWSDPLNPSYDASLSPTSYFVGQNYPNPFNGATKITFSIAAAGRVLMTVHDLLGRSVASLVDGPLDAGEHVVEFVPAQLSTGVYFARLNTGDRVLVRAMMYLK